MSSLCRLEDDEVHTKAPAHPSKPAKSAKFDKEPLERERSPASVARNSIAFPKSTGNKMRGAGAPAAHATTGSLHGVVHLRKFGGPKSELPSYKDLVASNALTVGDRVFCSQRKGRRFYGDLLPDGRIRYSTGQTPSLDDLHFPSPTAFNNFCGQIADPAYEKGNGFIYTFYKRNQDKVWMPLDYYRWATFGRSQSTYPKDLTRDDKAVSPQRLESLQKGKNNTAYGFTSDDGSGALEVSHDQRCTDAEQKRIDCLVAAVKGNRIYGKKLKAMHSPRKRKATANEYPDEAATADSLPTAHIQVQKGDEVELLFTKKPRKWVKGKVLSADLEHNKSFEVRIEIEDSDEFHEQVNAGCVDSLSKHACVTGSSVF